MRHLHSWLCVAVFALWPAAAIAAEHGFDAQATRAFLTAHCAECHGKRDPEGKVSLHALSLDSNEPGVIETWKRVYDQLDGGQMPPLDAKQPPAGDRQAAVAAIRSRLKAAGVPIDELRELSAARGNRVDHEALFSGQPAGEAGEAGRVWRVTPESYTQFFARIGRDFSVDLPAINCPWSIAPQWNFSDYSSAHRLSDAEIDHHVRNCFTVAKILSHPPRLDMHLRKLGDVARAGKAATPEQVDAAVTQTFQYLLHLPLAEAALAEYRRQLTDDLQAFDPRAAIERLLVVVLCHREVLYRIETPQGDDRSPLAPRHLARAIAYSLTDREPDAVLWRAVAEGKLTSREEIREQVRRMLDDPAIAKPRLLGFFQEYFGYTACGHVNKDDSTMNEMQVPAVQGSFFNGGDLAYDTDKVVQLVLESDTQVLRTLLTTRKSFICTPAIDVYRAHKAKMDASKEQAAARAKQQGQPFDEAKYVVPPIGMPAHWVWQQMQIVYGVMPRAEWAKNHDPTAQGRPRLAPVPSGPEITVEEWGKLLPFDANPDQRLGILTQPSWLIAQSSNFDNHPIHRGRWIREKLLGGVIPDVPITVNAMLPKEPHHGMRERMRVTRETYCWNCHRLMDPLGLPFEQFDHFGRYRTEEIVVDKEKNDPQAGLKARPMRVVPFDTSGAIEDSGDPELDGPVSGPFDLIEKLSKSKRVEQVFVRHVFRYFLGRNETLADGPTLVAAHKAYHDNDGSFKALVESLLSSDSFVYRRAPGKPGPKSVAGLPDGRRPVDADAVTLPAPTSVVY